MKIPGSSIYKNRIIQQHKDVNIYLEELFKQTNPDRVLEIGTSYGGFSLMLRDTLDELKLEKTPVVTYDVMVKFKDVDKFNEIKNLKFVLKNIFVSTDQTGRQYKLNCEETKQLIQSPGRTIIFVDGGNKKAEFNCLAEYIKPGDIILAHDYVVSKEVFKEKYFGQVWNWCEITESDITQSCETFGLVPFLQEQFEKVVWASKIKK